VGLIAFGWYGGKYSHLSWLLPLLPAAQHYCEPYGGSAAVLLNRAPSLLETYNDLDGDLVIFFRVLRQDRARLIEQIGLTPFARQELTLALPGPQDELLSDLERARRFYVRARQVRTGLAQTASTGRWAHCRLTSRAGMAAAVSRWLGGVEGLDAIAQRLLRVQIEHGPALATIARYDSPQTLFYCDPPYVHSSRRDRHAYGHEMDDAAHRALAQTLHACRGLVALSGYPCRLMDECYPDWTRLLGPQQRCHSAKTLRQEALWVNPALLAVLPAGRTAV